MGRTKLSNDVQTTVIGFAIAALITIVAIVVTTCSHAQKVDLASTFTSMSEGVVTTVESRRVRSGRTRVPEYTYHVSFSDSDKIEHSCESLAKTKRKQIHQEGDKVQVRYDPMNADEFCLIDGDEDYL